MLPLLLTLALAAPPEPAALSPRARAALALAAPAKAGGVCLCPPYQCQCPDASCACNARIGKACCPECCCERIAAGAPAARLPAGWRLERLGHGDYTQYRLYRPDGALRIVFGYEPAQADVDRWLTAEAPAPQGNVRWPAAAYSPPAFQNCGPAG